MEIKWLVEPRDVVVPAAEGRDAYEVHVDHGDRVDLPVEVARDLIGQGLAEMANKPKAPAKKLAAGGVAKAQSTYRVGSGEPETVVPLTADNTEED